jgi:hypothetical protein
VGNGSASGPAIVSKELFDKVQARIEWNKTRYRNANRVQLLSNLVACGLCGGSCFAYNRYYKYKRLTSIGIAHESAYLCTRKHQFAMHSAKAGWPSSSDGSDHGSRCSSWAVPDAVIAIANRAANPCDAIGSRLRA